MDTGVKKYAVVDVRVAPGTVDSNVILPIVTTIILLCFFIYLSYAIFLGMFQSQAKKSDLSFTCDPGLCAVDTTSGEKFCPANPTGTQPYNPQTQVCSNKYGCSNSTYKYAILPDGSTDTFGNCTDGIVCRCVNQPHCARYISSVFQSISGNPYTSDPNTEFNQSASFTGESSIDGPIIDSNTNTFCTIPRTWLFQSTPGCATLPSNLNSIDATKVCFSSYPCLYGVPAFITDDSDNFNLSDLDRIPVGCVRGESCKNNNDGFFNVTIYDTNLGEIVCRNFKI